MRPRVVRIDIYTSSSTPSCFEEHAVVALRAAIVILGQIPKIGLWIREIEQTPLINVARCRTGTRRNKTVLPCRASARYELCRIQLNCIPNVDDVRADIICRHEQVRCRLVLNSEIPGILRVRSHIWRHRQVRSVWRKEGRILVVVVRERIAAGESRPWIIQFDVGLDDGEAEWRYR